jgi:hypothetical protein
MVLPKQSGRYRPTPISPYETTAGETFVLLSKDCTLEEQTTGYLNSEDNSGEIRWLTEAFTDEELRSRLIRAVELNTSSLSDLTDLLAQVRPTTSPRALQSSKASATIAVG